MSKEIVPIEATVVEVSRRDVVFDTIRQSVTAENIQRYILGTKKNGAPRAVYDIVKDYTKPGKKKKKKKKAKKLKHVQPSAYDIYLGVHKKKKKKKKKKSKYWHI